MLDFIEVGPVPAEEDCVQMSSGYDPNKARAECDRFIVLIRATVGPEPQGARLFVRHNPHDFGTYYDVAVAFSSSNQAAEDYAYRVEATAPTRWP